jgi:ADP-heptose:LPS heptosyltransferase
MGEPSVSLAGRLTLEELAALIAKAPLLISNNTSAVHVASAVLTPVVDLYALTNPQHTPWRVPCRVLFENVPCRFCYKSVCPEGHHQCLRGVSPESVVAAAIDLLERTPAIPRSPECRDETTCLFEDNLRAPVRSSRK